MTVTNPAWDLCRWAVAIAACCNQLGLASRLGNSLQALLDDGTTADVTFELSDTSQVIWAHASIIAARCPKLYDAIHYDRQQQHLQQQQLQQQQQQQVLDHKLNQAKTNTSLHSSSNGRVTTVRLGKQVSVAPFRQVLQYIYTGHTVVEAGTDRASVRKLAHALGLKPLAMLASGAAPVPGAVLPAFSLAHMFPQQAVLLPRPPAASLQTPSVPAKPQHMVGQDVDDSISSSSSAAAFEDTSNDGRAAEQNTYGSLHPALNDLTDAAAEFQTAAMLPVDTEVPVHADLLLVPSQTNALDVVQHMTDDLLKPIATPPGSVNNQASGTSQTQQACCSGSSNSSSGLLGLAVHSAVLIAASPYFAAMLSDRWHIVSETCEAQQEGRSLPVAYLPTHDFEAVLCFVYFCYNREFCLTPWDRTSAAAIPKSPDCTARQADGTCARCQQARTAARLAAAAEALIVPDLWQQCCNFLKGLQERLPVECKCVVISDLAQLQQWDLIALLG